MRFLKIILFDDQRLLSKIKAFTFQDIDEDFKTKAIGAFSKDRDGAFFLFHNLFCIKIFDQAFTFGEPDHIFNFVVALFIFFGPF